MRQTRRALQALRASVRRLRIRAQRALRRIAHARVHHHVVTRVIDGDTIDVLKRFGPLRTYPVRVRVLNIDTPEIGEPLAEHATALTHLHSFRGVFGCDKTTTSSTPTAAPCAASTSPTRAAAGAARTTTPTSTWPRSWRAPGSVAPCGSAPTAATTPSCNAPKPRLERLGAACGGCGRAEEALRARATAKECPCPPMPSAPPF